MYRTLQTPLKALCPDHRGDSCQAHKNVKWKCPLNKPAQRLIAIIGKQIHDGIVEGANKSGFFSVLANGTTNGTQTEQFSFCAWYVEHETNIEEDFLTFVPVSDLNESGPAETLKTELVRLSLGLNCMRGQGYDGAAVMSGSFRGVQALIRERILLQCIRTAICIR